MALEEVAEAPLLAGNLLLNSHDLAVQTVKGILYLKEKKNTVLLGLYSF